MDCAHVRAYSFCDHFLQHHMVVIAPHHRAIHARFPGMDPGEEFQFYFRRHPMRLWWSFGYMTIWTLLAAGLTYFSGVYDLPDDSTRRFITIVLCALFIIPQLVLILRIYGHYLRIVIVTNKKVHQFKRTLLIEDRHESVDLHVLQDIEKTQRSVVQNMFGFGTLKLEAQNSRVVIHFTPQIDRVYNHIMHLRETARQTHAAPMPPIPAT